MKRKIGLLVALALVWATADHHALGQESGEIRVIVHQSNPVNSLRTADVALFFLQQGVEWPDGSMAVPIDQVPDSPARLIFSEQILGKDVSSVRAHWRRLIFKGTGVPPPTRASEIEIVQFVSANRRAIGYVSKGASLSADVKPITLID